MSEGGETIPPMVPPSEQPSRRGLLHRPAHWVWALSASLLVPLLIILVPLLLFWCGVIGNELIPSWIGSLATTAAVIAAVAGAFFAYSQLSEMRHENQAQEDERSAQQAHAVFFTLDPFRVFKDYAYREGGKLRVYNVSAEPVVKLYAHVRTETEVKRHLIKQVLLPTGEKAYESYNFEVLLAEQIVLANPGTRAWSIRPYEVALTFVDAEGRSWARYGDMTIKRMPSKLSQQDLFHKWDPIKIPTEGS